MSDNRAAPEKACATLVSWVSAVGILALIAVLSVNVVKQWDGWQREEAVQAWTDLHTKLAMEAQERGDFDDARRLLEEAVKLDPSDPALRLQYLRLFVSRAAENPASVGPGELDALGYSLALLSATEGEDATPPSAVAHARLLLRQGKTDESRTLLQEALESWPDYVHSLLAMADLERALGRKLEAREAFEKAVALDPMNLTALNNLGVAYVELDRTADGLAMFEQAIAANDNAASRANAADALQRLGRVSEALIHLQRAALLSPNSEEIKRRLATLEARQTEGTD